jgi:DmsE family decaheme c-type cytochrome
MIRRMYLAVATVLSAVLILGTTTQPTKVEQRPAPALRAASVAAITLPAHENAEATAEQCNDCHEDEVASFENTTHLHTMHGDKLACENAEPETKGAMTSFRKLSPTAVSEVCLDCHEKSGMQSHARQSEHMAAGVSCIECHDVHPSEEAKIVRTTSGRSAMMRAPEKELCTSCHASVEAEFKLPTHHRLQEGVVTCSNCHNPHGTTEQKQLLADSKENCLKCHEDKRGPFAFEHEATNQDGCLACHSSHGSSGPKLLKAKDERTLCVSCHSRGTAAGVPHSRLSLQASGDCTRCHSEIHGSHSNPFLTH